MEHQYPVGGSMSSQYPPIPMWKSPQSPSPVQLDPPSCVAGQWTPGQSVPLTMISSASGLRCGVTHSVDPVIHPST